jgi:hypothetical protein
MSLCSWKLHWILRLPTRTCLLENSGRHGDEVFSHRPTVGQGGIGTVCPLR